MKNTKNRSSNIFASIKEEEEKERAAIDSDEQDSKNNTSINQENDKNSVDDIVNKPSQVESAIRSSEIMAKSNEPSLAASNDEKNQTVIKAQTNNSGINYSNQRENDGGSYVNNGLLYIVPTRKKTRNHRKGFLLSDLALNNLQKEAAKYEISENDLINQILEKMV